jgi:TPR repeat protein
MHAASVSMIGAFRREGIPGPISWRPRGAWLAILALVLLAAPLLTASASRAETRVALVIGNGAYQAVPTLANPPNDARDVAEALKSVGFAVTLGVDLDQAKMQRAIDDFARSAAKADVSLFYYGGHGLQVSGQNYLIPVDAQLHTIGDIEKHTIRLDEVMDSLAKDSGIHLVFLDACRNNPIKNSNVVLKSSGLARVGNAAGFLIAFATQPDNVAFDGDGRNSPFAQSLLGHIATPGLDISSMMIAVRRDVIASTGGAQVPWENSSLTRQFYFAGQTETDEAPETMLWRLAGGQRDPSLLSIYLERFPKGPHASEVRSLLSSVGGVNPALRPENAVEDDLWKLALSARERSLVELYLKRYPDGGHKGDANDLLASLKAGETAARDPGVVCERLATHPGDATANAPGVDLATLAVNAPQAIEACRQAASAHPEIPHYVALEARAEFAAQQYDQALALYRQAADAGDGRALYSLGYLEEIGDHTPKDLKSAYALYGKAAERGNADGAINLAVALFEGKILQKNAPRAFALLQKAAETGSATATFDLGKLVDEGVAGKPAEALDLYKRAANLGEANGYRAAAALLDEGRHVARDPNGAADQLLRAVIADSGAALAELTAKTQSWSPDTVKAIQARLKAASYYAGPIDGRSGPALEPALKQWRLLGPPEKA